MFYLESKWFVLSDLALVETFDLRFLTDHHVSSGTDEVIFKVLASVSKHDCDDKYKEEHEI